MNEKDELKVKIPQCGNESQEEFYHRFSEAIEAIKAASARIDIDPSAATIAAYPVGTMWIETS